MTFPTLQKSEKDVGNCLKPQESLVNGCVKWGSLRLHIPYNFSLGTIVENVLVIE